MVVALERLAQLKKAQQSIAPPGGGTLKDAKESGTGLTDSHRRNAHRLGEHVAAVVRDMRAVVAGASLPAEAAPPGVGESKGGVG